VVRRAAMTSKRRRFGSSNPTLGPTPVPQSTVRPTWRPTSCRINESCPPWPDKRTKRSRDARREVGAECRGQVRSRICGRLADASGLRPEAIEGTRCRHARRLVSPQRQREKRYAGFSAFRAGHPAKAGDAPMDPRSTGADRTVRRRRNGGFQGIPPHSDSQVVIEGRNRRTGSIMPVSLALSGNDAW
jgi:hypothetical protein